MAGRGGGIGWALVKDILHPVVEHEIIINKRYYHTIKELKNGEGPIPSKPIRAGCTSRMACEDAPPGFVTCSTSISPRWMSPPA